MVLWTNSKLCSICDQSCFRHSKTIFEIGLKCVLRSLSALFPTCLLQTIIGRSIGIWKRRFYFFDTEAVRPAIHWVNSVYYICSSIQSTLCCVDELPWLVENKVTIEPQMTKTRLYKVGRSFFNAGVHCTLTTNYFSSPIGYLSLSYYNLCHAIRIRYLADFGFKISSLQTITFKS